MKIEFYKLCTCETIDVNGVDLLELTESQRRFVIDKAINTLKKEELFCLLAYICERFGKFIPLGICEQCGDYNEKYTLEINI